MTKVNIKRLDSVTSNDTTATTLINDNFQALQEAVENTLSRDGSTPNFMDADLDMNSYRIINSGDPTSENDLVTLKYIEEAIGNASADAQSAADSAARASSSAQSALVSATNAAAAVRNAEETIIQATELLNDTQEYVDAAKVDIDQTVADGKIAINQYVLDAEDEVKQIAKDEANKAIENAAAEATQIATEDLLQYVNETIEPPLQAYVTQASEYADNSQASATASAGSAAAALTSANNAKASETAAKLSENNALQYASNASQSATDAAESAELAQEAAQKASFGNIGDVKYTSRTDVPNGGAWCDGAEYTQAQFPDVYQMLVDGKLSSTDYSTFNNSVSTNGYCALFALDSSAQKFKVPKLLDKYVMDLADDVPVVGNGMALGISGKDYDIVTRYLLSGRDYSNQDRYGLLCASSVNGLVGDTGSEDNFAANTLVGLTTDPEKSGIIADTSNLGKTVTLKAYVVLYSSVAEASEVQAAEFIQGLSGKANVGLDNLTAEAQNKLMNLFLPDYSKTQRVSLPYTVPQNGVFTLTCSNENALVNINGKGWNIGLCVATTSASVCQWFIVSKGDVITLNRGSLRGTQFIPFKEKF